MLEKSIYEQLNEIDDTLCLENWKRDEEVLDEETNSSKILKKLDELEDETPKAITTREKAPLDKSEEYIPSDVEIDSLKGKSIKEILDALNELKHKKFKEFHPEVPSIRQKLKDAGFNL